MVRCSSAGRAVCRSNFSYSSRCSGSRSSLNPRSTYLMRTFGASGSTDRDSADRTALDELRLGRTLGAELSLDCCGWSAMAGMCNLPAMPQVMRFAGRAGDWAGALTMGASGLGLAVV
jgi:hypothetical protein